MSVPVYRRVTGSANQINVTSVYHHTVCNCERASVRRDVGGLRPSHPYLRAVRPPMPRGTRGREHKRHHWPLKMKGAPARSRKPLVSRQASPAGGLHIHSDEVACDEWAHATVPFDQWKVLDEFLLVRWVLSGRHLWVEARCDDLDQEAWSLRDLSCPSGKVRSARTRDTGRFVGPIPAGTAHESCSCRLSGSPPFVF